MDFFSVSLDKAFLISVKMKEQFKSVFYINMGLALQWCNKSRWVLIHWKYCNLSLLFFLPAFYCLPGEKSDWLLSKVNKQHKCCKIGALSLSSIFKVMGLLKSLTLNMTNNKHDACLRNTNNNLNVIYWHQTIEITRKSCSLPFRRLGSVIWSKTQ